MPKTLVQFHHVEADGESTRITVEKTIKAESFPIHQAELADAIAHAPKQSELPAGTETVTATARAEDDNGKPLGTPHSLSWVTNHNGADTLDQYVASHFAKHVKERIARKHG